MHWFGMTPNKSIRPESNDSGIRAAPAGHHVYNYLKGMREIFRHVSLQRIIKGPICMEASAWVNPAHYPDQPLQPARNGFRMEYINIGCQYGSTYRPFNKSGFVDQDRMQVQLHEIAHMRSTAYAKDQKILLPHGTKDDGHYNDKVAYGALKARVLAEFHPEQAIANAENIAFLLRVQNMNPILQNNGRISRCAAGCLAILAVCFFSSIIYSSTPQGNVMNDSVKNQDLDNIAGKIDIPDSRINWIKTSLITRISLISYTKYSSYATIQ